MPRLLIALSAATLLVSSCFSRDRAPAHPEPVREAAWPSADVLARACRMEPLERVTDNQNQPIPLNDHTSAFKITCPGPLGRDRRPIATLGYRQAAIFAVFIGIEEYVTMPLATSSPESFGVIVLFPDVEGLAALKAAPKPIYSFVTVRQVLTADDYAFYRARAQDRRDDKVYETCRALITNIDEAAKDLARSQACATSMEVIDRTRAQRREDEDRQQRRVDAENQRRQFENIQAQLELNRQAQEAEIAHQRRVERMRAIGGILAPPTTHTTCNTYGGTTNCTTR